MRRSSSAAGIREPLTKGDIAQGLLDQFFGFTSARRSMGWASRTLEPSMLWTAIKSYQVAE
jgi:hypothetical protein